MVGTYCCITGCKSNSATGIRFHRYPTEPKLRQLWTDAINNEGPRLKRMWNLNGTRMLFSPKPSHRVCGKHFIKGKMTFNDKVPSVFSSPDREHGNQRLPMTPEATPTCSSPKKSPSTSESSGFSDCMQNGVVTKSPVSTRDIEESEDVKVSIKDIEASKYVPVSTEDPEASEGVSVSQSFSMNNNLGSLFIADSHAWTGNYEELRKQIQELECSLKNLQLENDQLQNQVNESLFRLENLDDEKLKFYTGIDTETFDALFELIEEDAKSLIYWKESSTTENQKSSKPRYLNLKNELLLVLMRLRQGLPETDLAYRFGISASTVSRIFITWVDFLHNRLSQLPIWPSKQFVKDTMPTCYEENYPDTRLILDCIEIFIETPTCFTVQSGAYSSYKSHKTAKGLIGVSPSGLIVFVSNLAPGRLSERDVTIRSGVIDMLEEGDSIMADKRFLLEDLLSEKNIGLNNPPFLRGSDQLSKEQEEETPKIASLRMHLERTIRRVKSFRILQYTVPATMAPDLNKIWVVCCHLVNFSFDPVTVKEEIESFEV